MGRGHWGKPPTRNEKIKKHEKRLKKLSPCGRPPSTPANLWGEFFVRPGGARHHRWRARIRWNEVNTDTSGFTITIRQYKVEFEYSANDVDWFLDQRYTIPGKDDEDDNAKVHKIIKGINGRLAYRYRVRAIASDGCKSPWSDYYDLGDPTDGPPAPTNVKIKRAPHGIRLDWDEPTDVDDDDVLDERVSHYIAELYEDADFENLVAKKRHIKKTQVRFNIDSEDELSDEDGKFFGRVLSMSGDKSKSAWIPATANGNSDPEETPTGKTPKFIRRVFTFTANGKLVEKTYAAPERADDDYIIRRVTGGMGEPGHGSGGTKIDVLKNGVSAAQSIFDDDDGKMLSFANGDDDASTKQIVHNRLERGDKLRVRAKEVPGTAPEDVTVQIICDRID